VADTRSAAGEGSEPRVPNQDQPAQELANLIAQSAPKPRGFWHRRRRKSTPEPSTPPQPAPSNPSEPAVATSPVDAGTSSQPEAGASTQPAAAQSAGAQTDGAAPDDAAASNPADTASQDAGTASDQTAAGAESAEPVDQGSSEQQTPSASTESAEGSGSAADNNAETTKSTESTATEAPTDQASSEASDTSNDTAASDADNDRSTEPTGVGNQSSPTTEADGSADTASAESGAVQAGSTAPQDRNAGERPRSTVGVVYEPDESPDGFPLEYGNIIVGLPKQPENTPEQSSEPGPSDGTSESTPTGSEADKAGDSEAEETRARDAESEPGAADAHESEPGEASAAGETPGGELNAPSHGNTAQDEATDGRAEHGEADRGDETEADGGDDGQADGGDDTEVDGGDHGEANGGDHAAAGSGDDREANRGDHAAAGSGDDAPGAAVDVEARHAAAVSTDPSDADAGERAADAEQQHESGDETDQKRSDVADVESVDGAADSSADQSAHQSTDVSTDEAAADSVDESTDDTAHETTYAATDGAVDAAKHAAHGSSDDAADESSDAEAEAADGAAGVADEEAGESAEGADTDGSLDAEHQAGDADAGGSADGAAGAGDGADGGAAEAAGGGDAEELTAEQMAEQLAAEQAAMALITALMKLRGVLAGSQLPLEVVGADEARQQQKAMLDQLDDYLLPRLVQLEAPVLAVVGGSTGAGKSTLVNTVIGKVVSEPGVLRPTTRSPVLIHHPADADWFVGDRVLPGMARTSSDEPGGMEDAGQLRLVASDTVPRGLAILDAPDIDSVVQANRDLATQLLAAADLWLFVTTAARYSDAVPWEFLQSASDRSTAVAVVLDRAPSETIDDITGHLAQMLLERGLGDSPLFPIQETVVDGNGMLPSASVASIKDWLVDLAADAEARAAVVRRTLQGAVSAMVKTTPPFAAAVKAQADTAVELRSSVEAAYDQGVKDIAKACQDGTLLRGEVLARWQEFVGTGELLKGLQSNAGRLRERLKNSLGDKPAETRDVSDAIQSGLESLLREHATAAAERAEKAWQATAPGRQLLAIGDTSDSASEAGLPLGAMSEEFPEAASRAVREWQAFVLEVIRKEGGAKKSTARILEYGLNGLGLSLMVVVFARGAGIPKGAEASVGAGSAVVGQRLLEVVFGDKVVPGMVDRAREDLDGKVHALMDAEFARYLAVLDQHPVDAETARQLTEAARAVEDCT
jgi:hypothetical protein